MIFANETTKNSIISPMRKVIGKAELYGSSAAAQTGEIIRADNIAVGTTIEAELESKNLIPYPYYETTKTLNGIKFIDNGDGSISVDKTANANAYFTLVSKKAEKLYIEKGQTYTLNVLSVSGSFSTIYAYLNESDGTDHYELGDSVTFTANSSGYASITFVTVKGFIADNLLIKPQLEKGTKATPYTPYVDISSSNGEVKAYGRNLIPFPYYYNSRTINGVTFTVNDDTSITMKGIPTANTYFYLVVGKSFGVSNMNAGQNESATNGEYVLSKKLTYYARDKEVYIFIPSGEVVDETIYPQLEKGTTLTEREPCKSPALYPISPSLSIKPVGNTTTLMLPAGVIATATYTTLNGITEYKYTDRLQSIDIERAGEEGKFFGFGVSHKATITLQDKDRELDITTANAFKVYFGDTEETFTTAFPLLYVSECKRDENTNALTITAYCRLQAAEGLSVGDLGLTPPYTLADIANGCSVLLCGAGAVIDEAAGSAFNTEYAEGANFEGTEKLREVLNDLAEATQTIFYLNAGNKLAFKRLSTETALTITKADYFTLQSKTDKTLGEIVSTNELGDAVSVTASESGCTQYVRDNAFWEMREDIAELLGNAIAAVGGLTINQLSCSWRGNYLAEVGDRLEFITKDSGSVFSYLLNDTTSYNGGFSQETQWEYKSNENDTAANPSNLGETLKQTFAKVDKTNKKIDIVASEASANSSAIASLQLTTDAINASVNEKIADLKKAVDVAVTAEDLTIAIETQKEEGASKVVTSTGFTFDETGLSVKKSGSEMETQITEDGMQVFKNGTATLTANNEGVKAVDLHAETYLIIGTNSRFEDYGTDRTGCFWIGG
jgi:hypothetical protein